MSVFTSDIIDSYIKWNKNNMVSKSSTCGYYEAYVSSDEGMLLVDQSKVYLAESISVYICTNCYIPTFTYDDIQVPGNKYGITVNGVPKDVNDIYEKVRSRYDVNTFAGVVLLYRKLLIHVAVGLGTKGNLKFVEHVNYLNKSRSTSVRSHDWVDQARKCDNEVDHEIQANTKGGTQKTTEFYEIILKINYEHPSEVNDSSGRKSD